jgi:hypothetical protein
MCSRTHADAPEHYCSCDHPAPSKEIIVTASTDLTASSADPVVGSADEGPAQEMADQMADVAGAMFALLLLQAPEQPVHPEVPHPPAAEPAAAPVALATPPVSVAMPPVQVPTVATAVLDGGLTPVGAAIPSIAMPASLPMPDLVPQLELEQVDQGAPSAPDVVIPVIAAMPAPTMPSPTMAMLSEIEFLDE